MFQEKQMCHFQKSFHFGYIIINTKSPIFPSIAAMLHICLHIFSATHKIYQQLLLVIVFKQWKQFLIQSDNLDLLRLCFYFTVKCIPQI